MQILTPRNEYLTINGASIEYQYLALFIGNHDTTEYRLIHSTEPLRRSKTEDIFIGGANLLREKHRYNNGLGFTYFTTDDLSSNEFVAAEGEYSYQIIWSNHNILFEGSTEVYFHANNKTGETLTPMPTANELISLEFGIVPRIPRELIDQYEYFVIDTDRYLYCSTSPFYVSASGSFGRKLYSDTSVERWRFTSSNIAPFEWKSRNIVDAGTSLFAVSSSRYIVFSNHDVMIGENGTEIFFAKSNIQYAAGTNNDLVGVYEDKYYMPSDWFVNMGNHVRRLTGATKQLTPIEMDNMLYAASGSALPSAEDYAFGGTALNYGLDVDPSLFNVYSTYSVTFSTMFEVQSNISVIGFRVPQTGYSITVNAYLWDDAKNLLASCDIKTPSSGGWNELYLSESIQLQAGKRYVMGVFSGHNHYTAKAVNVASSSYIELVAWGSASGHAYPTNIYYLDNSTGVVYGGHVIAPIDIIIGQTNALPNDYQVALSTMNQLATATQGAVGVANSMTPKSMIDYLSSLSNGQFDNAEDSTFGSKWNENLTPTGRWVLGRLATTDKLVVATSLPDFDITTYPYYLIQVESFTTDGVRIYCSKYPITCNDAVGVNGMNGGFYLQDYEDGAPLYIATAVPNSDLDIYEISGWRYAGLTHTYFPSNGTRFIIGANHDIYVKDTDEIRIANSPPIPETTGGDFSLTPLDRNAYYRISGETLNKIATAIQRIVNHTSPLSPKDMEAIALSVVGLI